jgi:carbonic anhydrase
VWSNDPEQVINDLPNVALTGDRYYRPIWMSSEMAEYTGTVMAIDPSGRGQDETGYAVVKILHGNLFVVAAGGFSDGYSENTLKALSLIAKEHKVNHVIVEANFGDGMFTQILKPIMTKLHPVFIEEVKHSFQKERRIADTLEPVMNQHRLIFDTKVIEKDYRDTTKPENSLVYQMTRLTRDRGSLKHDDKLDALAMAVGYWVQQMARDTDAAVDDHKKEMLDKELKKFRDDIFNVGRPSSGGRHQGGWI